MQSGFDIHELVQEAQNRWLKPAEVYSILKNHKSHQLTQEAPQKPSSGSLFLFNKRVLRFFRRDGHSWRKKKDGRTVGEAHERLKVGNVEALNCYYAHGEQNPNFQRRSYWMLDPAYEHVVLVHYREINEGRHNAGSSTYFSLGSPSTISQTPSLYTTAQNPGSVSGINELHGNSFSPGSIEVSSELIIRNNGMNHLDGTEISGEFSTSSEPEVNQALRRLEQQLSLNDNNIDEELSSYSQNEKSENSEVQDYERVISREDTALLPGSEYGENGQCYSEDARIHEHSNVLPQKAENSKNHLRQLDGSQYTIERRDSPSWNEMLELCKSSTATDFREKCLFTSDGNENSPSSLQKGNISGLPVEQQESWPSQLLGFGFNNAEHKNNYNPTSDSEMNLQLLAAKQFLLGPDNLLVSPTSTSLLQEDEESKHEANPDYYSMWFDRESQLGTSFGSDLRLTISQKQRFTIREISPEWGYEMEDTKVIIAGSFLCDPSECAWTCMFGGVEIPVQIIQDGVLRCLAPPHAPGKVTLCITTGNRESCSEVREFEYRINPRNCARCNSAQMESINSSKELLLLVRFVQMLLCAPLMFKGDGNESGINLLRNLKVNEDPWEYIIEALLVGNCPPSSTMYWLVQELLKDKLQQWLSSKNQGQADSLGCSLSKKEQGIIHMVSGLGFEWALNPILNSLVSINFRDNYGWTALHWAAFFGREKMVAALIAAGASAGAVTDPTSQDPTGKTPAFIAASSGHKGLAGYLSEVALTSHLSSLTLEESELSKGSAAVEAEITLNRISEGSFGATEDQLSLKDSLAAVRNAAQAAARIQSAFRAHSFRRRQQKDDIAATVDEYGMTPDDIHELSIASKMAFRNLRDRKLVTAALSIQKRYRGWKGRKDFLALRQKIVKIQAHVRGHQVRKKYKVFVWTVGILDKVILRWRRRGVGLRGFRPESEPIDESEDEDILKVFRKQKVDAAIDEAVSRVLSMVESPDARQQYHRILESYREAKAELKGTASEVANSQGNSDNTENDEIEFLYP